jgi:hypothetical protein
VGSWECGGCRDLGWRVNAAGDAPEACDECGPDDAAAHERAASSAREIGFELGEGGRITGWHCYRCGADFGRKDALVLLSRRGEVATFVPCRPAPRPAAKVTRRGEVQDLGWDAVRCCACGSEVGLPAELQIARSYAR